MDDESARSNPVVISSDDLPPRDRIEIWREMMKDAPFSIDVEPISGHAFRVSFSSKDFNGLTLQTGSISGLVQRRLSSNIAGDSDLLLIHREGGGDFRFGNRQAEIASDTAVLLSGGDTGLATLPWVHCTALYLNRAVIAPMVANLGDAFMRPIATTNPALRLLNHYLEGLMSSDLPQAGPLSSLATEHIYSLAALALGATQDTASQAKGGVRAARFAVIGADCIAHLSRHDLSVGWLAARHGLSPRYIHMLFEDKDTTFTQFVRSRRLDQAQRILADPRHSKRPISDIAYGSGFSDLSYFNRSFRLSYGVSPSEFRTLEKARSGD